MPREAHPAADSTDPEERSESAGKKNKSRFSFLARAANFAALPLILAPVVFAFVYVHLYGVDVPYNDTWTMVALFEKLDSGDLTFADLFAQHNEHRILFPRLAMLALGVATAFDNVAIMYATVVCLVATTLALLLAFARGGGRLILFVPIPFLVFSLGQYWNLLQSFQITLVFAQTFGVLSLALLYASRSENPRRFVLAAAIASGVIASFSAAPGLLVWPSGLLLLFLSGGWKSAKVAVWSAFGALVGFFYFYGFERPPEHTASRYLLEDPVTSAKFFVTMLGGALFREPDLAFAAGTLLVFLIPISLLFVWERRKARDGAFWISLLPFSLLTLAATTFARGGSGMENALNEKYVTYSVLAVISLYAMLVKPFSDSSESSSELGKWSVAAPLAALILTIAWSVPQTYEWGMEKGREVRENKQEAARVLVTHESRADGELGILRNYFNTSPETARKRIATLEELHYSVFSEDSEKSKESENADRNRDG